MSQAFKLRIRNASQVVQIACNKEEFKTGADSMNELCILENATLIADHEGTIIACGPDSEISQDPLFTNASFEVDINAEGKSVVPGLVDPHTHPVWSGDRVGEFAMKLRGATYMEIHEMGGGISYTVLCTRESSPAELETLLRQRLDRMLKCGTTLIEAKSGYGLDLATELKMLKVLHAAKDHPISIVATYLGAHSIPKGSTPDAHARDIIENQLPVIQQAKAQGEIDVEFVDAFMEEGIFGYEDTKRILTAAQSHGFKLNFHGDELHTMHSAELAAEIGAHAVSHLEKASDAGIHAMAAARVHAVLLPTCPYILKRSGLPTPDARKMIEAGVPVSLASDFNPNAHCYSMPLVMNMACLTMQMTMNEALVASTLNAAASIGQSHRYGSLEVGKAADLLLIDHPNWEHLVYAFGDPPIAAVVKHGALVQ